MGRPWFAPKRTGYGATPSTWEGWALTLCYIVLLWADSVLSRRWFGPNLFALLTFVVAAIIVTAAFVLIVYKKTDGAWRWRVNGEPQ
jgi:hypothetical protein